MERISDFTLQAIFVAGLIIIGLAIYFTRIIGLQAGDELVRGIEDPYDSYVSVYQFEQEEKQIETAITILKADYASDLMVYTQELDEIQKSGDYSELEKREKIRVLENIYSEKFFRRKMELIEEKQTVLKVLQEAKCQKFCVYEDLPVDL